MQHQVGIGAQQPRASGAQREFARCMHRQRDITVVVHGVEYMIRP
jgi:hypothetical protein